jgi:hypothetical protein
MRSAFRTLENRCEISSTVRPARRLLMRSNKSCSAQGSRAAVGSSKITNGLGERMRGQRYALPLSDGQI